MDVDIFIRILLEANVSKKDMLKLKKILDWIQQENAVWDLPLTA